MAEARRAAINEGGCKSVKTADLQNFQIKRLTFNYLMPQVPQYQKDCLNDKLEKASDQIRQSEVVASFYPI
jgi:hypothetical protein